MKDIFRLENVIHQYSGRTVLDIQQFEVREGEALALLGPNGSGKSTLLRILAFLEKPTKGRIYYNGEMVKEPSFTHRREVTLLLQSSPLLKRSVEENLYYGLKVRGRTSNMSEKVEKALEMVGLDPKKFAKRKWFELSGGEAQRVALASRLILKPRVLLLDEPTSSVDSESAKVIKEAILKAKKQWGSTLVIVSHDLAWIYQVTDRALSLFNGKLINHVPDNVLSGNWEPYNGSLLALKLPDGQIIIGAGNPMGSSTALLDPKDVIICTEKPEEDSALNALKGTIVSMNLVRDTGQVLVKTLVGDKTISTLVTEKSMKNLHLHPGLKVFLHFKASALKWLQ